MRVKFLILILALAAVLTIVAQLPNALAQDPTPTPTPEPTATPEPTPEPTPTPGDTISTALEEPGENCAQGGVKITTTHPPPAEPDVEYVCNGDPGQDGQDGADGQDGQDGRDGQDGFDGQDGQGSVTSRASCGKASRVVNLRLPSRFRHVSRVTLVLNGHRRGETVKRRAIPVDLKGLRCGSYPAVVQRRGVRSYAVVLTLRRSGRISRQLVR